MGREVKTRKKTVPKKATTRKTTPKKKPASRKRAPKPKVESAVEKDVLLSSEECVRLNLGSGDILLEGYDNIDLKFGTEVYPLNYEDESVDEIRASHVLEHFPYERIQEILAHWVAKLKPGGVLKIAVPDFKKLAEDYLAGMGGNFQGFIMGGHQTPEDCHQVVFDGETLLEALVDSGLVRIAKWESDITDTATSPWSLNLVGYKPASADCGIREAGIQGVLGAPRFGPVLHMRCAFQAFQRLNIPYCIIQGCFWSHNLCNGIQNALEEPGTEYILTCDYDSVFDANAVLELYRLLQAYPEIDAICALQGKRDLENILISMRTEDDKPITEVPSQMFMNNTLEITTGHFGLTLIRASALRDFPKPWMNDAPNADGEWKEGKLDADISFWKKWREEHGKNLYLAPKVVIGHHVEVVMWPDRKMKMTYQTVNEYYTDGQPSAVAR
jgi:hypothetical protein